jgi:hypothetical protein
MPISMQQRRKVARRLDGGLLSMPFVREHQGFQFDLVELRSANFG